MADKLKLVFAALLLVGALGGFYFFAGHSLLARVIGLLVVLGVVVVIVYQTALGKQTAEFLRESRVEVRKVVWPTRKETLQTTMAVLAMVVVLAVFLWGVDALLLRGVEYLTGRKG